MTRLRFRNWMVLLPVSAYVACSVATNQAPDTIVFSHHVHSEQGLGCRDCHAQLLEDAEMTVEAVPSKSKCAECHDVESKESCATCHRNPQAPGPWQGVEDNHLVFSHKAHGEYGYECENCHKGAANWPDRLIRKTENLAHPDCASCHQDDLDAGRCRICHERLDLDSGKPEQVFSHEKGFFDRHGVKAQGGEDMCAQCHDQTYCADCHAKNTTMRPSLRYPERVDREFMHRGDWMSRHSLEARTGDTGCMKCHGASFCSSCHERTGMGGALGVSNPHADISNWVNGHGADSHGRAARRRIAECAACHDQGPASNCIQCHSAGGAHSFNPHPPGWDPPVPKSERAKHEMCRICHSI
jgi:hypothetical protein